jgi:hypothetical protein
MPRLISPGQFVLDVVAVAAAAAVLYIPFPKSWIEDVYANGLYAYLNREFVPLSNAFPTSVGDVEAIVVILIAIVSWLSTLSKTPRWLRGKVALALVAHTIGWLALGVVLFEVLWGWNYRRAPVATRVEQRDVSDAAVAAFSARIVGILNHDVAAAHAEEFDRGKLAGDFLPIVDRLGDLWPVEVTIPKGTLLEPYYEAAGIGGQYSPFAFETLLNTSFLKVELPRALAHEWAHVAGFTDEGDANFIGTLTCLRSKDPLIRYSGAFWTYGDLPEAQRRRFRLDPRVNADYAASRARYLKHYMPGVFAVQWNLYDRYLRSSGVRGGVASYGYYLRMLVGTRLDDQGLPVVRKR